MKTSDIITKSMLPYLPLYFNPLADMMLEEARSLKNRFVLHRDKGEDHKGWLSLCLHGTSPEATEYSDYMPKYGSMDQVPWKWQGIAPKTEEFFQTCFPVSRFLRVRFMLLKPGGYVAEHVDTPGQHRLYPINIPLNAPEGCNTFMRMKDRTIRVPYELYPMVMLDIGYPHMVYNESKEDRYIVIVHYLKTGKVYDWLVQEGYQHMKKHEPGLVNT